MNNLNIKRSLVASLLSLFLFSCSGSNLISSSYSTAFEVVTKQFSKDKLTIDIEVIKNIPYASSIINFKGSSKALVILESKRKNTYTWVSSDEKVFITRGGRVVSTIGLPNNLYKIRRPEIDFGEIISSKKEVEYFSYYSFKGPDLNDLKVKVTAKVVGKESIKILDEFKVVLLIEEKLYSHNINWREVNRFWVDPGSFYVWKSEQHISPRLPLLYIETTKKPAI